MPFLEKSMNKVFEWYLVQDCLPSAVTIVDGIECHGHENSELLKALAKAMYSDTLNIYDNKGRLQSPPTDLDLTQYLNPIEINKWFIANDLPYEWIPEKLDVTLTLQDRIDSGELQREAIKVAQHLEKTGTNRRIGTEIVSVELAKMGAWDFKPTTLDNRLRVSWWKVPIQSSR
jgi:hypothetical protein